MDKPTLVLLHGALGCKEQFSGLETGLKDEFRTYTLNFEGHGGRQSGRSFSMNNFMENLLEFLEKENLSSANFFGYSMGGYIALQLAIHHPEKVQRIMTLGTKFKWTPESAAQEVKRLDPQLIEEKVPKFAQQLKERHAPLYWPEVLNKTGEMMLSLGNGTALTPADFGNVRCPVLITVGSEDNMVSLEESLEIAKAIPNTEFHLFQGFKHPLEQVDVEQLGKKVREFMG